MMTALPPARGTNPKAVGNDHRSRLAVLGGQPGHLVPPDDPSLPVDRRQWEIVWEDHGGDPVSPARGGGLGISNPPDFPLLGKVNLADQLGNGRSRAQIEVQDCLPTSDLV